MQTENDEKKITENDAKKKKKRLTEIQVLTNDLTLDLKVMRLVKPVNY